MLFGPDLIPLILDGRKPRTFMEKIALAVEVRDAMRKHRKGRPVAFDRWRDGRKEKR